jgi:hypothetical protein
MGFIPGCKDDSTNAHQYIWYNTLKTKERPYDHHRGHRINVYD